jgi:2-isopropylmalate synthase
MATMPFHRYRPSISVDLPDRIWPTKTITKAPIWCSVDLRDGNQALINPMGVEAKCKLFALLVRTGFKQIEVGFPAASQTEFDFVRTLIEKRMIPDDVTIQVLTQARESLIRRTFEAVQGAQNVIVHLYNSTSELQRRVVFGMSMIQVTHIAIEAATLIKQIAAEHPETYWTFQYSPESFTGTELHYALDVCTSVLSVWRPTPEHKVIINLPATVEMTRPNVYADMIEWMHRHMDRRDSVIISLHTHNDRGMAVAATELGLLAGAQRVEGTLFGNGERTGNVDIITLAGNLMSEGIDPELDISDMTEIVRVAEECTNIEVHPRHPYAGELAYTAFSGSHQDAVNKGLAAMRRTNGQVWEVPYLPIDPADIGRIYRPIRINSQSGKGGIAYVMEHAYHLKLPRGLQIDFSSVIQRVTDSAGTELTPQDLLRHFNATYIDSVAPLELIEHFESPAKAGRHIVAMLKIDGVIEKIEGEGNGSVDAFIGALCDARGIPMKVDSYESHSIAGGSDATAVAYVSVRVPGKEPVWGVGMHTDITKAPLLAVVSAVNRL